METVKQIAWWRRPELAGLASLVYALWCCRHLAIFWRTSAYDAGGGLAFFIWMLPVIVCRQSPIISWMLAGLAVLTLAGVAELNVLAHVGLALIVAAWVRPVSRGWWPVWLAGAIAWMPSLGYLLAGWPVSRLFGLRILLALATLPLLVAAVRQNRKGVIP